MIDDERLSEDLRAALARRDPGGAPPTVEPAVLARLRAASPAPRFPLPSWIAAWSATAILLLVVLAIGLGSSRTGTPAATPGGGVPPPAFGLVDGDGTASGDFVPVAQIAAWVVALILIGRAVLRSRSRSVIVAGTIGALALLWVAFNAGTSDAVVDTGMVGTIDPYSDAAGTDRQLTLRVDGDEPFRTILVLGNQSRLPLTLRGLVPTSVHGDYVPPLTPRFVGMGRLPDNEATFDHVVPFEPVVLPPDGLVSVALLGMSGSCAAVPAGGSSSSYGIESVTLVYEQLTIIHTANVRLVHPIQITTRAACPGAGDPPAASRAAAP